MVLDLILENIRNNYKLGLLEENISEKEILQNTSLINEATMTIRKILVENGLMNDTKIILENMMVKGALGVGGLYAGSRAAGHWINKKIDDHDEKDIFGGHPITSQITSIGTDTIQGN